MKTNVNFINLFALIGILPYFISVSSISLTLSPTDKFVFLNDNVEFNCKIRNDEGHKLVWLIKYNYGLEGYTYAEVTQSIEHEQDGHGSYSLAYSTEIDISSGAVIHNLVLRITRVQLNDEGTYTCGYETNATLTYPPYSSFLERRPFSSSANLSVLVPPNDIAPGCGFSPSSISVGTTITLACEMSGGKPLPGLTWYREGAAISSTMSTSNSIKYTVTPNDDGISFTCKASGQALPQEGTCSVKPFQVDPAVTGLMTSTILSIFAAVGGFILILIIATFATIIYKCHKNAKQGDDENQAVESDNTYEMGNFSGDRDTQGTQSTYQDSANYVINQVDLSDTPASPSTPQDYHGVNPASDHDRLVVQRSVTMGSDHTYDHVNFAGQPATGTSENGAPPAYPPPPYTPYDSSIVGNSYAEMDMGPGPRQT